MEHLGGSVIYGRVFLGVFILLLSQAVSPVSMASIDRTGTGDPTNATRDMSTSCYDDLGRGYIDLVPHSGNCNLYIHCIQYGDDFLGLPRYCAEDFLEFSLITCRCEYPDTPDAMCFDAENPDHLDMRMKCATLVDPFLTSS